MATRVYFRSEGTPDVTPSTWIFASQINPVSFPATLVKNSASTMTSKTEATGTTSPIAKAMGRAIIGPLNAQTLTGTVKGQMRGSESNAGANATLALAIKFIKPDGTDRGVLLAQTASDAATVGHELTTALTNAKFEDAAESAAISLTSRAASDGDYLVIEWGFRSATTTTRNIVLSYGNDSATDLPEDTSTTAANNPWVEFSQTILVIRQTVGASAGIGASSVVVATIGTGTGSSSGVGASSVVASTTSAGGALAAGGGVGTGTGSASVAATASAAGVGSSAGTGTATNTTNGSANGTTALSGTGASTATGDGVSQGTAAASGAFATTPSGVGASLGASTTSAGGAFITSGVGDAIGSSASVVVGMVITSGLGVAHGAASSAIVLTVISAGECVSQGVNTTSSVGIAITTSVALAAGVDSTSVIGSELHWSAGQATSISTSLGVSGPPSGSAATATGSATSSVTTTAIIVANAASVGISTVAGEARLAFPLVPLVTINILPENRIIKALPDARMISVPSPPNWSEKR